MKRKSRAIRRYSGAGDVRGFGALGSSFPLVPVALGLGALFILFGRQVTNVASNVADSVFDFAKVEAFKAALQLTTRWLPLFAPLTSKPGSRSAAAYFAVCKQFNVATSPRYIAVPGATWCNIYAWDASSAMGAEIPHWYDPATGAATFPGKGTEMRANDAYNWLSAGNGGWQNVTLSEARIAAAAGKPTVIAYYNPNPGHSGHIAMMLPNGNIAQAGAHNYFDVPQATGFGALPVRYFTHA